MRPLLLLPLLLLLAACNGRGTPDETPGPATAASDSSQASAATATAPASPAAAPSPTPTVAGPPRAAATCAPAFPPGITAGSTTVRTVESGGLTRQYRLHIPAAATPGARLPLVLNFHGLGSAALEQEVYSGLVPVSDREGFVLVSPEGTGSPRSFAAFDTPFTQVDDVQFTSDLLDHLEIELCIDPARIYSTGLSNGAFMSSRLACALGDRIAAIGAVAGVYFPLSRSCDSSTAILAIHGTLDAVVPFEPGLVLGVLQYAGARTGVSAWAAHLKCGSSPSTTQIAPSVTLEAFEGCSHAVELYVLAGGGHTWPGPIEIPRLGPTIKEISAAEVIWQFFATHPRE